MNAFNVKLSELIKNCGKQQNEISKDLGISKQKISKWKTGYTKPTPDDLILLASYFQVSTDYLLGLEDESGTKIDLNKKT